ncbi:hypothetical protein INH39_29590 [Massilia violaceinigra]|uniref:NarX-like N-terminal domain-containing protein n=1 Tax=Massilia violaceinigra TaxID=2045208 RepID=A0ABY4A404_9BURK|nr:hypothetical protein [Massilia violaceinigra]UOD29500.1 hypothetical protein INH39_29590 [Massilia violaceinigra]
MKAVHMIVLASFTCASAMAQVTPPGDDCQDLVKLRDRSVGIGASIAKIDLGGDISILNNNDMSSRFMTLLLFEFYLCRLDQALVDSGKAPIPADRRTAWTSELEEAFDKLNAASNGKMAAELTSSVNAARSALLSSWLDGTDKAKKFNSTLESNVASTFLSRVPKVDYMRDFKGSAYVKYLVTQGLNVRYDSVMAKGDELVGDQRAAFQQLRTFVALYARGDTSATTMLRSIIMNMNTVASQLASRKSAAMVNLAITADANARASLTATAASKLAELENRVAKLEAPKQE